MSSLYSIEDMNKLADALEQARFTPEEVVKLKDSQYNLKLLKYVVSGHAKIQYFGHPIDCDAEPFTPEGYTLDEHRKDGATWMFDASNIILRQSKQQKTQEKVSFSVIEKEITGLTTLNANVLDYLLLHPELIPMEWCAFNIHFPATTYKSLSSGEKCFRHLCWMINYWGEFMIPLSSDFRSNDYVATLKK